MADVKLSPPQVVWETEDKGTMGRIRLVKVEKHDAYANKFVTNYKLESAETRDAMGAWQWTEVGLTSRAARLTIEEFGRRCGCEGEKAEVSQ